MRFKILVLFLAMLILGGTFAAAYWWYQNVNAPEDAVVEHIKEKSHQVKQGSGPDPGLTLFAKAMELVREGQLEAAREHLTRLTKVYRDSARFSDARRILGEMNVDRLFSRNPMPGKYDYTVKAGDTFDKLEKGSLTTFPFLLRLNNLTGTTLHPGERIVYQPLEFQIEVDVPANRLTLSQKNPVSKQFEYFKDYRITSVNLPPGTGKTMESKIAKKDAFINDRPIRPTDPLYQFSKKWLQTTSKGGRLGLLFRGQSEHDAGLSAQKPGEEDITFGVFLDDGDIEELNTIVRIGTPVTFRR